MSQQKTVIVGLSGRLDSTVAAYLLKKQGFNVIGVGIVFADPKAPEAKLAGPALIESINTLKELADTLDITFYATNAEARFKAEVIDPFVEARLFGQHFCIESAVGSLMFEVLDEKRQALKAAFMATGHYAKVGRSHVGAESTVFIPNDPQSDQSYALSSMDRKLLANVIFPLSDLRKVEVEKIGKLISGKWKPSSVQRPQLLFAQEGLADIVNKYAAPKLFKEGMVIKYCEDSGVGEHKGLHQFFCGQKKIQSSGATYIDRELEVVKVDNLRGIVYVDFPKNIAQSHLVVGDIKVEEGFDQTKGREVWIQYSPYTDRIKGSIQFLNNGFAIITLAQPLLGKVYAGYHLSLASKAGVGAKIIGSARVIKSGVLDDNALLELPLRGEEAAKKTTESKWDFVF